METKKRAARRMQRHDHEFRELSLGRMANPLSDHCRDTSESNNRIPRPVEVSKTACKRVQYDKISKVQGTSRRYQQRQQQQQQQQQQQKQKQTSEPKMTSAEMILVPVQTEVYNSSTGVVMQHLEQAEKMILAQEHRIQGRRAKAEESRQLAARYESACDEVAQRLDKLSLECGEMEQMLAFVRKKRSEFPPMLNMCQTTCYEQWETLEMRRNRELKLSRIIEMESMTLSHWRKALQCRNQDVAEMQETLKADDVLRELHRDRRNKLLAERADLEKDHEDLRKAAEEAQELAAKSAKEARVRERQSYVNDIHLEDLREKLEDTEKRQCILQSELKSRQNREHGNGIRKMKILRRICLATITGIGIKHKQHMVRVSVQQNNLQVAKRAEQEKSYQRHIALNNKQQKVTPKVSAAQKEEYQCTVFHRDTIHAEKQEGECHIVKDITMNCLPGTPRVHLEDANKKQGYKERNGGKPMEVHHYHQIIHDGNAEEEMVDKIDTSSDVVPAGSQHTLLSPHLAETVDSATGAIRLRRTHKRLPLEDRELSQASDNFVCSSRGKASSVFVRRQPHRVSRSFKRQSKASRQKFITKRQREIRPAAPSVLTSSNANQHLTCVVDTDLHIQQLIICTCQSRTELRKKLQLNLLIYSQTAMVMVMETTEAMNSVSLFLFSIPLFYFFKDLVIQLYHERLKPSSPSCSQALVAKVFSLHVTVARFWYSH